MTTQSVMPHSVMSHSVMSYTVISYSVMTHSVMTHSMMTLNIMTLSITTISTTTISTMTLSTVTLSTVTLSTVTLSTVTLNTMTFIIMPLRINQHKGLICGTQHRSTLCRVLLCGVSRFIYCHAICLNGDCCGAIMTLVITIKMRHSAFQHSILCIVFLLLC